MKGEKMFRDKEGKHANKNMIIFPRKQQASA